MDNTRDHRLILVVDLDHTLVKTNTLFELMSFLCPLKYVVFSRILKPFSFFNVILGRDVYKLVLARMCFNDLTEVSLEQAGRVYYEKIIRKRGGRYNQKILNLLKLLRNTTKMLLTASSDFIARNFKQDGFDIVYSSKSIYRDGIFQGLDDLYLRKYIVVKVLSRFFGKILVIDDNPEKELYFMPNVKIIRVEYHSE